MLPPFLAADVHDAEGWWQLVQKNGVGFIFFILFVILTGFSVRREKASEEARAKRENEANADRLAMQTEIRDLNKKQFDQQVSHSTRLEQIIKDGNKAQADVGVELKNLARRMKCAGSSES